MLQNEKNNYKLIGNNLFSIDYKEFYKSEVGPREESRHVFVRHVDTKKLNQHSINILEIGFGNGDNLVNMSLNKPNDLFIGCDAYYNGCVKLLKKIVNKNRNWRTV